MGKYKYELGLALVAIVWGSGFVGTQLCLDGGFTPIQIISGRFLIASFIMGIIFFKLFKNNINKKLIRDGSILGVFLFVAFILQTIGLDYTTPSKNAFITATNVVIVPFIAYVITKEKLDKIGIISSIMALSGIAVLSLEADFSINIGDFLTLICAFGFAFHIYFTGRYSKDHNPICLTIVQFFVAGILSYSVQIIFGEQRVISTNMGYVGVVYLALFSTLICFLTQTICQRKVKEEKVAMILSTEAVFGTIFSAIILKEVITLKMIIGIVIIFSAIIISETKLSFIKSKKEIDVEQLDVNIE